MLKPQIGHGFQLNFQDGTLFGNDAGEDEQPDVLASYFVDQFAFAPFLDRSVKLQIARSRKGMGKSALLSKLNYDLELVDSNRVLVVRTTGTQLIDGPIPLFQNLLEAQNYWISHICSRINASLGAKIGFAFSDTQMSLVETAEISGLKGKNLIGSLISRMRSSKIPIEIIAPTLNQNADELLRRASENLSESQVWFLVDDIDASYIDSEQQQLLVSSFFSACRFVAREMKGVNVRATVRSDVWANLRSNEDLDKCEQYVVDISWTKSELKMILAKKIFSWIKRKTGTDLLFENMSLKEDTDSVIEYAFDRTLKWGKHRVAPFQPINILSAGRPRWMSQLCRLAGVEAAKHRKAKINIADINYSMPRFTRYRLDDLVKEHKHQYAKLDRLIQSFAGKPVRYLTTELLSHINKDFVGPIGVANVGTVDGEMYSSPLQLAHLLFKTGFLLAREGTGPSASSAKFITFSESPDLLKYGNNPGHEYEWEIYPSYRQRSKFKDFADDFTFENDVAPEAVL